MTDKVLETPGSNVHSISGAASDDDPLPPILPSYSGQDSHALFYEATRLAAIGGSLELSESCVLLLTRAHGIAQGIECLFRRIKESRWPTDCAPTDEAEIHALLLLGQSASGLLSDAIEGFSIELNKSAREEEL
jgi:hypothetical protein